MVIVTMDGGTTNTRVLFWKDGRLLGKAAAPVWVRVTAMEGSDRRLKETIRRLLDEGADATGVSGKEIGLIIASGMLTSNLGLMEIPHETAPLRPEELASRMVERRLPELAGDTPFWFVPGVKNMADQDLREENCLSMDMMRGEETEAAALLAHYRPQGATVLVLPGSHNKYIAVTEDGRIAGCLTSLTGELLQNLTENSILAGSVARGFAERFLPEPFLRGVRWGAATGLGHGAFLCRIHEQFFHDKPLEAQNYLLGLLLGDDWKTLVNHPLFGNLDQATFLVAGRPVMQQAYQCLFAQQHWHTELVREELQQTLAGRGALELAFLRGLIQEEPL